MLRGCLMCQNEADKAAAKLPECARPSATERFQCMIATVKSDKPVSAKCHTTTVIVNPDGTIAVQSPRDGELWLSGISFTLA